MCMILVKGLVKLNPIFFHRRFYKMDRNDVKAYIRALLSSTVVSYDLKTLLTDFRETSGCDLPLFGFQTPVDFLMSMTDTVKLVGNKLNPEVCLIKSLKSTHITDLVDKQKNNKKVIQKPKRIVLANGEVGLSQETNNFWPGNPDSRKPHATQLRGDITHARTERNTLEVNSGRNKPRQDSSSINFHHVTKIVQNNIRDSSPHPNNSKFVKKKSRHPNKEECKVVFPPVDNTSTVFDDSDSCSTISGSMESSSRISIPLSHLSPVNDGIKNKLKQIIKKFPDGLWCCELPNFFLNEYNQVLDYREFGYASLIEMMSELPDVFRCVRPGKEDWILFDASAPPSSEEKTLELIGDINCEIKTNLQKLISWCETTSISVDSDSILSLYHKMFGKELDYKSLGFEHVNSLLETLDGTILSIYKIDGNFIVNSMPKKPVESNVNKREEALPPITPENDLFVDLFPNDVVGPEESFVKLDLKRHLVIGQLVEVCVAEVWSPSKFYLQLNKFRDHLNRFMDDLQKFYNIHLNKYKMPEATIRPDQICVGLYNSDPELPEEWHRAQIKNVINEKTVCVCLVDYGTETRVRKSQLRFLHRSFHSFPVQAFAASLAGVNPLSHDKKWPLTTSKRFLELLHVPYLEAHMVEINFKKSYMSVMLFDPSRRPKTNLNKRLVAENLALFKRDDSLVRWEESFKEDEESTAFEQNLEPFSVRMTPVTLNSSGMSSREEENFEKNSPEVTDEFLDILDLDKNKIFFKSSYLRMRPSTDKHGVEALEINNCKGHDKIAGVSLEFEEVSDLECTAKENEEQKLSESTEDIKVDAFKVKEELLGPVSSLTPEENNESLHHDPPFDCMQFSYAPQSLGRKHQEKVFPTSCTMGESEIFRTPMPKLKRLPPGLENCNGLLNVNSIQLLMLEQQKQQQEHYIKKQLNALTLQLLMTNPNITQVALTDPELALKIATQMAKTYLSTFYNSSFSPYYLSNLNAVVPNLTPNSLPDSFVATPLIPPPGTGITFDKVANLPVFNTAIPVNNERLKRSEGIPVTDTVKKVFSEPSFSSSTATKTKNCVKQGRVGEKVVHVLNIDNQLYLCMEEIIQKFTVFTSREVASRILELKKIYFKSESVYKIITMKKHRSIVKELQTYDVPEALKSDMKNLEIHLLALNKTVHLLESLGCNVKPYKAAFKELEKSYDVTDTHGARPS